MSEVHLGSRSRPLCGDFRSAAQCPEVTDSEFSLCPVSSATCDCCLTQSDRVDPAAIMSRTKAKPKLLPFDAARYLTDDAAAAEHVTAVLETGDSDLLVLALGDIARARGMAQVAKDAGLGRESLYKALARGAKPRFDAVMKVAHALGVHFTARVQ